MWEIPHCYLPSFFSPFGYFITIVVCYRYIPEKQEEIVGIYIRRIRFVDLDLYDFFCYIGDNTEKGEIIWVGLLQIVENMKYRISGIYIKR
jgi:hypothetical protein